jgi:hypothetical protein
LRKETVVWLGPFDTAAVKAAFLGFFQRRVVIEGDVYVGTDSQENIQKHRDVYAQRRGYFSGAADMPLAQLLTPCGQDRLRELQRLYKEEGRAGLGGSYIGDVSQSEKRPRGSPWIPPCSKTSALVAINCEHLFTPLELDLAHGWPLFNSKYSACVPLCLKELNPSEARSLAGNGMHLSQVFAWLLFTLSHVMSREHLKFYHQPLAPTSSSMPTPLNDGDEQQDESSTSAL